VDHRDKLPALFRASFVALALVTAACGAQGGSEPTPVLTPAVTRDVPRYTLAEVRGIAMAKQIACYRWEYKGNGLWKCGTRGVFDERTGVMGGLRDTR
jgi:hypothetical protein